MYDAFAVTSTGLQFAVPLLHRSTLATSGARHPLIVWGALMLSRSGMRDRGDLREGANIGPADVVFARGSKSVHRSEQVEASSGKLHLRLLPPQRAGPTHTE